MFSFVLICFIFLNNFKQIHRYNSSLKYLRYLIYLQTHSYLFYFSHLWQMWKLETKWI